MYLDVQPIVEYLAAPDWNQPLLERRQPESEYRAPVYQLTDVGLRVLEGETNHVDVNGIDRWIGGVHFSSEEGQIWWRRDGHLE